MMTDIQTDGRRRTPETERRLKIEKVRRCLREMDILQRDTARRAIVIGTLLIELRADTPHGGWEGVCKEIGMSRDTASNYMKLAKNRNLVPDDMTSVWAARELVKRKCKTEPLVSPKQMAQVLELRDAGQSNVKIAAVMPFSKSTVRLIVTGKYKGLGGGLKKGDKRRKLSDVAIIEIEKELVASHAPGGQSQAAIAAKWGVSQATISKIHRGRVHTSRDGQRLPPGWSSTRAKLMAIWHNDPAEYEKVLEQIDMRHQVMRAKQAGFAPGGKLKKKVS